MQVISHYYNNTGNVLMLKFIVDNERKHAPNQNKPSHQSSYLV